MAGALTREREGKIKEPREERQVSGSLGAPLGPSAGVTGGFGKSVMGIGADPRDSSRRNGLDTLLKGFAPKGG